MTHQEIFNTVLFGLRKQGVASVEPGKGCRYRGPNGTKCAVGMLIPDDKYHWEIETLGTSDAKVQACLPFAMDSTVHHLLSMLQSAHDIDLRQSMEEWEIRMANIAHYFNLEYTTC
jgi:hypothetical protein